MLPIQCIFEKMGNYDSNCVDGRLLAQLAEFMSCEQLKDMNMPTNTDHVPLPWTEETVLNLVRNDLAFAFEKVLNKQWLSSSHMYNVMKMWMWILEDAELAEWNNYSMYGLPLYKEIALKYGFPNEIGEELYYGD